ncbi:MAG: glycosyltransferase, partial [Minisyncoccia bacterium]
MKIVFTGGGTGGHFYPIIAVAEKVNQIIDSEHILGAKLYYFSDSPYDKEMLAQNGLFYEEIKSGKMRTYFSFRNFLDIFKTFFGVVNALFKMFSIYPDVVFGKGGYASFPTIFAARILRIPVVIHESDSAPGRVNKWAGHFAKKIAISFPEAAEYFPEKKTAWTGQPVIA